MIIIIITRRNEKTRKNNSMKKCSATRRNITNGGAKRKTPSRNRWRQCRQDSVIRVTGPGELFPETEVFMIALQDQLINTRNCQKHIMKGANICVDRCSICGSKPEIITHSISGCSASAQADYDTRQGSILQIWTSIYHANKTDRDIPHNHTS